MSDRDDMIDAVKELMVVELMAALDEVSRAVKFLVSNGINPVDGHQRIAYAWAKGHIDDEEFLLLAGLISDEEAAR